jgi:hypothetical protein
MLQIFEKERRDGLAEKLAVAHSIAFEIVPSIKADFDASIAALLTVEDVKNAAKKVDLFYFECILASVGWNKNDDVFDPRELWLARSTPVNKKINYMHDETDIIGHMVSSKVFDFEQNLVSDSIKDEEIPDKFDIVVGGLLYKYWEDDSLKARIVEIIDNIAKKTTYVSMECIFPAFDYAVITPDGYHKVIARTEDTAFLTKHLRRFGGTGSYEGFKVGRLLRNMVFTGNGIVDKPANPRSLIISSDFKGTVANINLLNTKVKQKMEFTKEFVDALTKRCEIAEAKANEVASKELDNYKSSIASLKEANDKTLAELAKAKEELKKVSDELSTSKELVKANEATATTLNETIKNLETQLAEAKVAMEKHNKEVKCSARKSALAQLNLDEAKANDLLTKFADISDEAFAAFVENFPKKVAPAPTTAQEILATAEVIDVPVPVVTDTNKDMVAKASAWFGQNSINKTKTKE